MNIQPTTGFAYNNSYKKISKYHSYNKINTTSTDIFNKNVNFGCNYTKVFYDLSTSDIKNSSEAIAMFNKLFFTVVEEPDTTVTPAGKFLVNELKENGLIKTLADLSQKNPPDKYKQLILDSQEKHIPLIKKDSTELFNLYNMGAYKFFDIFSDDILSKPRHMELCLSDSADKKHSTFNLSSDKNLEVNLADEQHSTYIKYYGTTGVIQKVIEQKVNCNPEITYYNRDGSKSFFKNLFFGGPAVPVYYT